MKTLKLTSPPLSSNPATVFIRKSDNNKYIVFVDGHTVFELSIDDSKPLLNHISGGVLTDDDIAYLTAVIKEKLP